MKFSDPKRLSLFIAAVITAMAALLFTVINLAFGIGFWIAFALTLVVLFIVTATITRYSIEKFLYEKIRLVYKTIHQLKRPKDERHKKMNLGGNALENVYQEVIEWGQDQSKEIEELKRLAAYRREFIGNVTHELKTPIFNIQGYVLTLLDGGLDDPAINREYLMRTDKSINRLITIVRDLESIAQLESGELKLNWSKFDIVALTSEVIDFLEIKVRRKDTDIVLEGLSGKPTYVFADKERIREVLINLIDNSVKYGSKPNSRTTISFFDMDENLLVEVTDNGIGISKTDIPRVFERFYRTDKARSREQGGTGLGLAIVKHIIEAHRQTINVRSTLGVGTTFGFTLEKAG